MENLDCISSNLAKECRIAGSDSLADEHDRRLPGLNVLFVSSADF
jgi:hypothetical protein